MRPSPTLPRIAPERRTIVAVPVPFTSERPLVPIPAYWRRSIRAAACAPGAAPRTSEKRVAKRRSRRTYRIEPARCKPSVKKRAHRSRYPLSYDRRVSGEPPDRPLDERDLDRDPAAQFRRWLQEAENAGVPLAEATILATATPDGAPSARAVLLKRVDERGFVFFTNRESRKARELAANARAALVFYWNALGRQVRVEGAVEEVPDAEADAYFGTRPRGSRIGAWASPQSDVVSGREELEARVAAVEERHGDAFSRPPFWGGYRVVPHAIEFWQHRENRLHDRLLYRRGDGGWTIVRLAP
ncbi:MAG: pyridoxamine 5'-phosphate oxidase [Actinobacteria bacterium]|nr:pyridoxamine 5'-phosphate oxidase [Actinomycetota bacterium]